MRIKIISIQRSITVSSYMAVGVQTAKYNCFLNWSRISTNMHWIFNTTIYDLI